MKKELAAGAVIFFKQNSLRQYLLLLSHKGDWGFAKGKCEEGEDCRQTAVREIKEETGLDVQFVAESFEQEIHYTFVDEKEKKVEKTVFFFLARAKTKEITLSSEHTEFKWLPFEEAKKQLTYENDREVLGKAKEIL